MTQYLMRAEAPLSDEQWTALDEAVTHAARRVLVGRRFIPLFGPFGAGLQVVATDTFTSKTNGLVNMLGETDGDVLQARTRCYQELPLLYKDFRLHWRDLEASRQFAVPLDPSPAAAAAAFVAHAEDRLIFHGDPSLGWPGLLGVEGRQSLPLGDWTQPGRGFAAVVAAIEALLTAGYHGPYALVTSPRLYALLHRVYDHTGVLEIEQVRKLAEDGVFQTPVLAENCAVVVATGPENMDLAVAQDMVTAFLETSQMNHYFRVLEILALRIKRPGAICTLKEPFKR